MFGTKKDKTAPAKGIPVVVHHELINADQAEVFVNMMKDTVKIIVVGAVITIAAGVLARTGMNILESHMIANE